MPTAHRQKIPPSVGSCGTGTSRERTYTYHGPGSIPAGNAREGHKVGEVKVAFGGGRAVLSRCLGQVGLLRWRQKEISTHKTGSKGPASQRGLRVTCMQFPEILVEDAHSWPHQGLQKQTLRRGWAGIYILTRAPGDVYTPLYFRTTGIWGAEKTWGRLGSVRSQMALMLCYV